MLNRFKIHTVKRSVKEGVIADYWLTTIYDRETGNAVTCAGDTPSDSEENATVYLAMLNGLSNPHRRMQQV